MLLPSQRLDMQGYVIFPKAAVSLLPRYVEFLSPMLRQDNAPGKFHFIQFDPDIFTWVMSYPEVKKLIFQFCGKYARLDNHFCFSYPGEGVSPNIHGGPFSEARSVYYQDQAGCCQTSNLKVGIAIQDQRGVAFLPGSHKCNYPVRGCDIPRSALARPKMTAGDIVVFTDALIHGTVAHEKPRQMLYYTFTPGHVAWAEHIDYPWVASVPADRRLFFRPPGLVNIDPEDRANVSWKQPTAEE